MLIGSFEHMLDAKGRVFIPAKWRESNENRGTQAYFAYLKEKENSAQTAVGKQEQGKRA